MPSRNVALARTERGDFLQSQAKIEKEPSLASLGIEPRLAAQANRHLVSKRGLQLSSARLLQCSRIHFDFREA